MVRPKQGASELIDALARPNCVDIQLIPTGKPRRRVLHHLTQWGCHVQFRVHSPDVKTALRGLLERVFYHWETRRQPVLVHDRVFEMRDVKVMVPPFRPTQADVTRILGPARSQLLRRTYRPVPMTREQFLARLGGSKRARYAAAADSLDVEPISVRDSYLQTFVKAEKLNVTAKPDPDPRVIQPRSTRYCYAVGLYIKGAEHNIYKAINRMFGARTVMKGLNADTRGAAFRKGWDSFEHPVAVGLDASRFDQHVSRALLSFEHSIYNSMYHDPYLRKLLAMQLRNRGFVRCDDGSIKYTVDGSRMSGDMNTSLGNIILMCLMVYSYMSTKGFQYRLFNDGDDCVLMFERHHLPLLDDLPQWFQQLGMLMKVEDPVFILEQVEFCQSHPIQVEPGVWRMVRDPRVCLSKDLCVVKPVHNVETWNLMRYSISECGLALAGDVPVYNEFYNSLQADCVISQRSLRKYRERGPDTGMEYLAVGMHRKYRVPHWCCRVSFWLAFGLTPDEQVALEDSYRLMVPKWRQPESVEYVESVFSPPIRW